MHILIKPLLLLLCLSISIAAMAQSAGYYLSSGNKKTRNNNFSEAIADYTKAIAIEPGNYETYGRRAYAELNIKLYREAVTDYNKAIALKPNTQLYFDRALAESDIQQYKEATADYDLIIAQKPNYACAYNNRGNAKYDAGRYKDAIADYTTALNLDEKHHKIIYVSRADAYASLKQYDNAIADHNKAVETDPTNKAFYDHNSISKKDLETNADQLPEWKKDVIDRPCPNYYRGKFEFEQGMYERALNDMNQAISLFPRNKYTYALRTLIDSYIKDTEVTLKDIDKAISLDKNFTAAYVNKGEIEKHLGRYTNALADINQAITTDTAANSTAYINRGNLYLLTGEYDKAIADLSRGIKNHWADSAAVYNARGYAYYLLKDDKNALADRDAATAIGGKNYQSLYHYPETETFDSTKQWVQLSWISPVDDVNKLKQGYIALSIHDQIQLKVMLLSNARIKPDNIHLIINGKPTETGDVYLSSTLDQVKYDDMGKVNSYLFKAFVKLPKGKTTVSVAYDQLPTQQLTINDEHLQH